MDRKSVYFFGDGKAEGRADMKNLLGGKGANLAEMTNLGLPVPPGFTISTEICNHYFRKEEKYPAGLAEEVARALQKIEALLGMRFGDANNPLLVSVRSGARASMPGMMDTVLNLGLNDGTVEGLALRTGKPRFAWDSYRRFVRMYGDVVLGMKPTDKDEGNPFERMIEEKKEERGLVLDTEFTTRDLQDLVRQFKREIRHRLGVDFPVDPHRQLWGAIGAVFGSWMNPRAEEYRRLNGIPSSWGTAVNVQAMVFGNMGPDSGSGVAFTRDAATGENVLYGEYLGNAQGEDVVSGARTPASIEGLAHERPELYGQLDRVRRILEKHYRDMLDIEFTIQQGKFYLLQCRVGKRTAFAAIRIAVDMVDEKLITPNQAMLRVEADQLNQLLRPVFDPVEKATAIEQGRFLAKGLNAGPGAAVGRVVFNAPDAEEWKHRGERVILVRIETSPEDIRGMNAAEGILTARGGTTSHAALVARQMGKVCVAGCSALTVDYAHRNMRVSGRVIREGDYLSLDGTTGEVILGQIAARDSEVIQVLLHQSLDKKEAPVYRQYRKLMKWADRMRTLEIRANADQPDQAALAIAFGAEGIGLCRTEHMFFGEGKIGLMREMILAATPELRERALSRLLPLQREDFENIFEVMDGRPVTIRTLDPPLHEFLPVEESAQRQLAADMGVSYETVKAKVESFHEFNPMIGFRGCRLGIVYPEITRMQAQAIFEAAANVIGRGQKAVPEVMIPLVGNVKELEDQAGIVRQMARQVMASRKLQIEYQVGTMIEVPRGALTADEIARSADFFSFGTNDLTQTTLALSRDDADRFMVPYLQREIYSRDPFQSLDRAGVGELMRIAVVKGRATRPEIKIGICGEHGGDPATIEFCQQLEQDYVSCSPFRVPIARLAAAQAVIKSSRPARGRSGKSKTARRRPKKAVA